MKLRLGVVLLLVATVHAAVPEAAKSGTAARTLYARALDRERALREQDGASLEQLRGLAETYEAIARRFPASAYSDNALWQGGNVALLAFDRFGDAADRRTAERLLDRLKRGYPSSSLVSRVDEVLGRTPSSPRTSSSARLQKPLPPGQPPPASPPWPVALSGPVDIRSAGSDRLPHIPVQTAGISRLPDPAIQAPTSDQAGSTA